MPKMVDADNGEMEGFTCIVIVLYLGSEIHALGVNDERQRAMEPLTETFWDGLNFIVWKRDDTIRIKISEKQMQCAARSATVGPGITMIRWK
jgi:hypothetical protein